MHRRDGGSIAQTYGIRALTQVPNASRSQTLGICAVAAESKVMDGAALADEASLDLGFGFTLAAANSFAESSVPLLAPRSCSTVEWL